MIKCDSGAPLSRRSRWLLASGCAVCLVSAARMGLAGTAGPAGSGATTAPVAAAGTYDVQTANDLLLTERLLLQFYNTNAQKSYLGGAQTATPVPGTLPPAVSPGTSTTPVSATTSSPFTGPVLSGSLSGSAETPPVNSSATGTMTFTLSQDRTAVLYQIQLSGLSSPVTGIRVRRGLPGQPGGILLYTLNPPVNGVSSGQFDIRPGDVSVLLGNEFYVEVQTEQHPDGEIRGFLVLPTGTTTPPIGGVPSGGTVIPATGSSGALQSIINEIRANHSAHVATLEQMLGTSAQPAQSFQNLDAASISQFLTMAANFEDLAVGVAQNAVLTPAPGGSATAPAGTPGTGVQTVLQAEVAVLADDGRHAGALRAFRKLASTAEGGDPNTTVTESGAPFNVARTHAQLVAFMQAYPAASTPAAAPSTGGTTGTTTGGATGTAAGGSTGAPTGGSAGSPTGYP